MEILLRRVRRSKDITQAELAEMSGVSIQTIKDIERRQRENVQAGTLCKLAKSLEVPVEELLEY